MRSLLERRAFCRTIAGVLTAHLLLGGFSGKAASADGDWLSVAIKRESVESTNLASVGYNQKACVLEVEFQSGSVYRYRDVPRNAYEALMRAESKGRYFSRQIRGRYEFRRVDRTQP
jgi:hypothetical protein